MGSPGPPLAPFRSPLDSFGNIFGIALATILFPWCALGVLLGRPLAVFGRAWSLFVGSCSLLVRSWGALEHTGGALGALLDVLGALLELIFLKLHFCGGKVSRRSVVG